MENIEIIKEYVSVQGDRLVIYDPEDIQEVEHFTELSFGQVPKPYDNYDIIESEEYIVYRGREADGEELLRTESEDELLQFLKDYQQKEESK